MPVLLLGRVGLIDAAGREIPVPGAQRRGVLAILALELGRVVPLSRMYDLLWGDRPPPQAKAAVQGHVAALRKTLPGSGVLIETRPSGYRLVGPADAVDHARFLGLLRQAADAPGDVERLNRALDLWRGSALAGLPRTDLQRSLAAELEELRTQTLERWARLALAAANGASVIPVLEAAVRAEPLRESLVALLIRALHRDGRTGDAWAAYEHTRERLADELGIDPGRHLRQARAELVAPPAAVIPATGGAGDRRTVPRLLPPAEPGFVGRAEETARLWSVCGPGHAGPGRMIITGAAGVGKTAMAVHWAHTAAEHFPDGQLFVDLRGFAPEGALEPAEVLQGFLGALGLPRAGLPDDPSGLAALYQRAIRDLRLLVVLDNADDARQVRPLMAEGSHCVTLVTSRRTLEELSVAECASILVIRNLAASDAVSLLAGTSGRARVAAEPEAAADIAEFCGRLPLALLLCGARLALRPGWRLSDLARELADEPMRLAALDVDGSQRLLLTLELTRRHLTPDAARLLALLGLHPGSDIDVPAAAALLGLDLDTTRGALRTLAAHHLTEEVAPGRHHRHDLIQAYCARLLEAEVPPEARRDALERLLHHYRDAVASAVVRLERDAAPEPADCPVRSRVHDWFRRVEPVLRALAAEALNQRLTDGTVTLAREAAPLYSSEGDHMHEWEQLALLGARAAQRAEAVS